MKNFIFVLLLFGAIFSCVSCLTTPKEEYAQLLAKKDLRPDELFQKTLEFEQKYPDLFETKVDIASYYYLTGKSDKAYEYFQKAVPLIGEAGKDDLSNRKASLAFAYLSKMEMNRGNFPKAYEYADKAVNYKPKIGERYSFLKAHLLLAEEREDEALALFENLYKTQRSYLSYEDARSFMLLLAKRDRLTECGDLVDFYFSKGPYFPTLGDFACNVYLAVGKAEKAAFAAFLDLEYEGLVTDSVNENFYTRLSEIEEKFANAGKSEEANRAFQLIKSLYDDSIETPKMPDKAFFVEQYLHYKKKVMNKSADKGDIFFLSLVEKQFSNFASYYWTVSQAVKNALPNEKGMYYSVLKKVIELDRTGAYEPAARQEVLSLMGF